MIFEGAISVKAAIEGQKREVQRVYIAAEKKSANFSYIVALCRDRGITVSYLSAKEVAVFCAGTQHGGICAEVGEYQALDKDLLLKEKEAFFVYLEGIEDPYNYGYALRSLYAAGCTAVISPKRSWLSSQGIIARSSAGASEFIRQYSLVNAYELLKELKYNGVDILCSARKDAVSIYQQDLKKGIVICFGGEKRGLSAEIMKLTQQNIYIPYQNDFHNALNSASAVAVVAFEVYRQRNG